ncbi:hypothetical protein SAMN02745174_00651 [Cetobacterium ceti]|uniref:Zinc resistance-associated protein n=1 Tax=Cetobacterium ceti TaxID=180163 RepID=A0A1T4KY21_9FUSO|nr:hypothetical protein [Cetobacterium ceti]SJZ47250.1 hypothetical protein SAMN02745174_00651 [Cetobacterium ceti]
MKKLLLCSFISMSIVALAAHNSPARDNVNVSHFGLHSMSDMSSAMMEEEKEFENTMMKYHKELDEELSKKNPDMKKIRDIHSRMKDLQAHHYAKMTHRADHNNSKK